MFPEIYSFQVYKYVRETTVFKFLLWAEEGVTWLRRLVAVLRKWRPRLNLSSLRVEFVVEEVAPRKVFLRVLRLFPVTVILPVLRIDSFIYHRHYIMSATESFVK
jgi:hypothetical protein